MNFSETVFGFLDARGIDELVDSRPIRRIAAENLGPQLARCRGIEVKRFYSLDGVESDSRGILREDFFGWMMG